MDKETLQKKIESGDTVYSIDAKLYGYTVLELHGKKDTSIFNSFGQIKLFTKTGWWHWFNLWSLFATKEEAEWQLEFGNITRTEKLELPSWKDTETEQFYVFGWWHGNCELAMRRFDANDNCEYLIVEHESDKYEENLYGKKVKIVFKKPYNYENYLEACRLCKKLFLGEEL